MRVLFNTISNVQNFCKLAQGLMSDVDVKSGRYTLDGKSLMGLFSLDLSKPVDVEVIELVRSEKEQFETQIKNLGIVVD